MAEADGEIGLVVLGEGVDRRERTEEKLGLAGGVVEYLLITALFLHFAHL